MKKKTTIGKPFVQRELVRIAEEKEQAKLYFGDGNNGVRVHITSRGDVLRHMKRAQSGAWEHLGYYRDAVAAMQEMRRNA